MATGVPPRRLTALLAGMALGLAAIGCWPPALGAEVERLQRWAGVTPSLGLKDLAGNAHDLGTYRGRVVLINFWATWCDPCRDEMPSIARLQARLAGAPFSVLGVNYGESAARIEAFLKRVPIGFPVLLDRSQEASRAWRVRLLPASFIVGPDGQIRYHVIGEIDWGTDEVVAAIRRLMSPPGG